MLSLESLVPTEVPIKQKFFLVFASIQTWVKRSSYSVEDAVSIKSDILLYVVL